MHSATKMITIYGLKNCDTCQKAQKWLQTECIEYQFKDMRQTATSSMEKIASWVLLVGWEALINRRSTTWRTLKDKEKQNLDGANFLGLVKAHPALIKRPVFEVEKSILVGFEVDVCNTLKGSKND